MIMRILIILVALALPSVHATTTTTPMSKFITKGANDLNKNKYITNYIQFDKNGLNNIKKAFGLDPSYADLYERINDRMAYAERAGQLILLGFPARAIEAIELMKAHLRKPVPTNPLPEFWEGRKEVARNLVTLLITGDFTFLAPSLTWPGLFSFEPKPIIITRKYGFLSGKAGRSSPQVNTSMMEALVIAMQVLGGADSAGGSLGYVEVRNIVTADRKNLGEVYSSQEYFSNMKACLGNVNELGFSWPDDRVVKKLDEMENSWRKAILQIISTVPVPPKK